MSNLDEKLSKLEQEISKDQNISIVNLIEYLIEKADKDRVSDIHIDPTVDSLKIRFRIDGVLQESYHLPKKIHEETISRIKVLCKLRTDEHQSAQDGRFRYEFPNSKHFIDIRVSIVPTYHGENVVMRLLSDKSENLTLEDLGFSEEDKNKIISALKKPHGMILSTGPTGSGKTTTLYTLIKIINSSEISIITIEDPVEYALTDIEQIQVNTKSGLNFANGLRSILRQDPNVIMVGEIRDKETASIAVNTALTGHLLLSTMHTNDAVTSIPRLIDMGVEEYLIASTVSLIIGQRLVRKICNNCKEEYRIESSEKLFFKNEKIENQLKIQKYLYRGIGCKKCKRTGYCGRVSINEVLIVEETIKEAILKKSGNKELKELAEKQGMTTMLIDGMNKAFLGITTIEEVMRVINE